MPDSRPFFAKLSETAKVFAYAAGPMSACEVSPTGEATESKSAQQNHSIRTTRHGGEVHEQCRKRKSGGLEQSLSGPNRHQEWTPTRKTPSNENPP